MKTPEFFTATTVADGNYEGTWQFTTIAFEVDGCQVFVVEAPRNPFNAEVSISFRIKDGFLVEESIRQVCT